MALRFTTSRSGAAYAYLGAAGGLTVSHLLLPRSARGLTLPLLQLSGAVAIAVALRRSRPLAAAWWAIAAGLGMWAVGSAIWATYWVVRDTGVPFPGAADLFFAAGYPLMVAGVFVMARETTARAAESVIDGATVAVALGVVYGLAVVGPASAGLTPLGVAISAGYAAADVVMVTCALAVVLAGSRSPAAWLLAAGATAIFLADASFAVLTARGTFHYGSWVDMLWMGGAALWGAAALHPSSRVIAARPDREKRASRRLFRLPVTALSALVPLAILVHHLADDEPGIKLTVGAIVLIGTLVSARSGMLSHDLARRAAQAEAAAAFGQRAVARPLSETLDDAAETVGRSLRADLGAVLRLAPTASTTRLVAGWGRSPTGAWAAPAEDGALVASVVAAGRPVVIEATPGDAGHGEPAALAALGVRSGVFATVPSVEGPWGVIAVFSHRRRLFTAADASLLQSVANTLGAAVDRSEADERLRYQALHDPLTGLANRTLLADRVGLALRRRGVGAVGVLYIDLDDFKAVNDRHGHPFGDRYLLQVALRLKECARSADTVARLGGDEFAVLLDGMRDADEASDIARRISTALSAPVRIGGTTVPCGASIGSATAVGPDLSPEEIMRNADIAMYAAKRSRKGSYAAFRQDMLDAVTRGVHDAAELRAALDRGQLVLHYQPVVDLRSGAMTSVEALLRWAHPVRGLLNPPEWLPAVEATDLMPSVTRWVLENACRWAVDHGGAGRGAAPLGIAVNVSASELGTPELYETVRRALAETGLDPSLLCLEVTETAVLDDVDASVRPIRALREIGVTVAVDDFGTGFSSLAHLKRLPVDVVKIDKSFVDGLSVKLEDTTVVAAIIGLAHTLSLSVVAEGVETVTQLLLLRDMGCEYAQGFLLSRPLPGDAPLPPPHLAELAARLLADTSEPLSPGLRYPVVIVDDLEDDRRLLHRALERSDRFSVVGEAADGLAAVDLVRERSPSVVLLDIDMPGLDGLATLSLLRDAPQAPRVVLLSGYVTDETIERAHAAGASGVVKKSSPDVVAAVLDAVEGLDRSAPQPSSTA